MQELTFKHKKTTTIVWPANYVGLTGVLLFQKSTNAKWYQICVSMETASTLKEVSPVHATKAMYMTQSCCTVSIKMNAYSSPAMKQQCAEMNPELSAVSVLQDLSWMRLNFHVQVWLTYIHIQQFYSKQSMNIFIWEVWELIMSIWTFIIDIDECKDPANCDHGICTNTIGGFVCQCDDGFTPSLNRQKCLGQYTITRVTFHMSYQTVNIRSTEIKVVVDGTRAMRYEICLFMTMVSL